MLTAVTLLIVCFGKLVLIHEGHIGQTDHNSNRALHCKYSQTKGAES